jgi:hypothetical protein
MKDGFHPWRVRVDPWLKNLGVACRAIYSTMRGRNSETTNRTNPTNLRMAIDLTRRWLRASGLDCLIRSIRKIRGFSTGPGFARSYCALFQAATQPWTFTVFFRALLSGTFDEAQRAPRGFDFRVFDGAADR